jgi:hypothetical protein
MIEIRRGGPDDAAAILAMMDGRLVDYYRRNGFVPVETFTVGEWPGQVLARRVSSAPS